MAVSFTLDPNSELVLDRLVARGRYATTEDALRAAVRLLDDQEQEYQQQLEALREEIRKGYDSGPGIPADEVFDRLIQKYSAGATR